MPQLDFNTYFSQYAWFIVSFCVLYLMITQTFLPRVYKSLQVRKLLLAAESNTSLPYKTEEEKAQQLFDTHISSLMNETRVVYQNALLNTSTWVQDSCADANNTELNDANSDYVNSIGIIQHEPAIFDSLFTTEEETNENITGKSSKAAITSRSKVLSKKNKPA